jgi:hypothetical protein
MQKKKKTSHDRRDIMMGEKQKKNIKHVHVWSKTKKKTKKKNHQTLIPCTKPQLFPMQKRKEKKKPPITIKYSLHPQNPSPPLLS